MQTKMEELTSMKTEMEKLAQLVKLMAVTQTQPPPPPPGSIQAKATTSTVPEWTFCADTSKYSAPQRSLPWGPPFSAGEIFRLVASEAPVPTFQHIVHVPLPRVTFPLATMAHSAPVAHVIPEDNESIFHPRSMGAYDRVDELQEKYDEMQREMRALRGKEIFGKTAYDLCLVPNVQIPHRFKVPDFEKYKGNSCPKDHLTIYARKMAAYAKDD